jgi:GTPase
MFIDFARIFVKAGNGGSGACSFRREKFVPYGGPDGGDGGNGGNVTFVASSRVSTLLDFRYQRHYEARSGQAGQGRNRHGSNGQDVLLPLPVGTIVKNEETGETLADLVTEGQTAIVARGGKGGRGNSHFATSTNRAPRKFEEGTPGEARWLTLELKLLADVGLVGFPNAGKSTLISTISAAHPEIASYPFTTLRPHLGVVAWGEHDSFVVADIPGLIEGAHDGKGLGIQFLRHIQRTAFLLYMIDVSEWAQEDPLATFQTLRKELEAFDPLLLERSFAIAGTKIDAQGAGQAREALETFCLAESYPFFPISSATRQGITELVRFLGQTVTAARTPCATNC